MTLLQDRVIRWLDGKALLPGSETSCVPEWATCFHNRIPLAIYPKGQPANLSCLPKAPVVDDLAFAKQSNQLPA